MFKSIATAALVVSFAGAAVAEDFTAQQFLTWSKDQQTGFVTTSLAMAAALAPSRADCISTWAKKSQSDSYANLGKAMQKYQQYHPTGVLVALIEKECGQLTMAQK